MPLCCWTPTDFYLQTRYLFLFFFSFVTPHLFSQETLFNNTETDDTHTFSDSPSIRLTLYTPHHHPNLCSGTLKELKSQKRVRVKVLDIHARLKQLNAHFSCLTSPKCEFVSDSCIIGLSDYTIYIYTYCIFQAHSELSPLDPVVDQSLGPLWHCFSMQLNSSCV